MSGPAERLIAMPEGSGPAEAASFIGHYLGRRRRTVVGTGSDGEITLASSLF